MYQIMLLLCLTIALPGLAAESRELNLLLLSHLPENLECFDPSQSLKAGIYVDQVNFVQTGPEVTFGCERKLVANLPGYPDYFKEIDVQKMIAWGYYDVDFTLSTLYFISLQNKLQVYEIKNKSIRGLCKSDHDQVLFFSSRNPTVLNAFSMDDLATRPAKVEDNVIYAENVGVKIRSDGTLNFTGLGMQEYSPGFRIPEDFVQNNLPGDSGTWLLLLHREHSIVLASTGNQATKKIIVWDKDSGRWRCFELDQAYVNIKLSGKYLLFQTDGNDECNKAAYVFNLATDELGSLRLMPFTKIIYYSEHYTLLAQPYQLLAAAHTPDGAIKILKTFDYPLAWYVKMAVKD